MSQPHKVFISYSQESAEHSARVLALSDRLRTEGIDCTIDQYEVSPPEGWPRWMDRQVEEADFVLVVCTATYLRRVTGQEKPGKGLGVRWESLLIFQGLYDAGSLNERFVPVVFDPADVKHIPKPLRGATHVVLDGDKAHQKLLRRLYNIPPAKKPLLGTPVLPRPRQADFFTPPKNNLREAGVAPNLDFVGREAVLRDLANRLAGGNVAITHALSGEGGVGKTQIAAEFVFRHAGDYDGVWWVDASNAAIEASLARLADTLGLGLPPTADPPQIRAAICQALSAGKHLLVLDNLEKRGPDQGDPLATLRLAEPSRVLVTTRRADLRHDLVDTLDVQVFEPSEAVDLFCKHRPDLNAASGRAALEPVAAHLDYHALAVTMAAAYLRQRRNVSPAELLERLKRADVGDTEHLFEGLDPGTAAAGYRHNVAASLSLHLPEFAGTPAMALLRAAAFCHPDGIPIDLLADAAKLELEQAEDWLRKLADVSVIKYQASVSIHRLTQSVIRACTRPDETHDAVTAVVAALADRFEGADDYRNWPMQDAYAAHAQSALSHAERTGATDRAGYLGNGLGLYFENRARLDEALAALRAAERVDRAAFGDTHPELAADVNNIGGVLKDKGDLDGALKCFREAERIDRAAFGDNHPEVATDVNNIGRVLQDKGDLDGALKCFRAAEGIDRAAIGDNYPEVARDVNNIGSVLQDKGDLDGALKCFREAERIDRAAFGDNHPDVATVVNNIGGMLKAKGDLDGALKCFREAERIDRAAFGDNHPNVARDVSNIGVVLWPKGERDQARRLITEAFRIQCLRLGPRALDTLDSARNLRTAGLDPIALGREIAGDEFAADLARALKDSGK